ncbi:porin [Rhodocyclus tenuis]|uniref:Putative porin n=1 Tax=Rhodocyclus tenuis TaxID=1066 RepID=A0A840G215_RHOTE|nr:porin [Rhodocyclus tenuis]MBB4245996.1 putative porin [Rhodocyclus tenuis]
MQKKLIALAVAGLVSGGAYAQSNVTVYGVVDVFAGQTKADDNQVKNGIDSGGIGGSRIGFKGEEALGNGLKAIFTLEYGLTVDANQGVGTGTLAARQQYLGLSSNTLGTVIAGRLQTPGFDASNAYGAGISGGAAFSPLYALQQYAGANINSSARANNAIAYVSPTFAGFSGKVAYVFGEETTSNDRSKGYELGADYKNGPLAVSYVYSGGKDNAPLAVEQTKDAGHFLGASYDFGIAKLKGSYQREKTTQAGVNDLKFDLWQIGADVPVTAAGAVRVGYAQYKNKAAGADDDKVKAWTLGYTHSLSKRTTAYAAYTRLNNDNAADAGINGVNPTVAGGNGSILGAGINHAF